MEEFIRKLQIVTFKLPNINADELNDYKQNSGAIQNEFSRDANIESHVTISTCNREQYIMFSKVNMRAGILCTMSKYNEGKVFEHNALGKVGIATGEEALKYMLMSSIGAFSKVSFDSGISKQFSDMVTAARKGREDDENLKTLGRVLKRYRELPELKEFRAPSEGEQITCYLENRYGNSAQKISITVIGTGSVASDAVSAIRKSGFENIASADIAVCSKDNARKLRFMNKHKLTHGHTYHTNLSETQLSNIIIVANGGGKTALLNDSSFSPRKEYDVYDVTAANGISTKLPNVKITNLDTIQHDLANSEKVKALNERKEVVEEITDNFIAALKQEKRTERTTDYSKMASMRKAYEATGLGCTYITTIASMLHKREELQKKLDRRIDRNGTQDAKARTGGPWHNRIKRYDEKLQRPDFLGPDFDKIR